MRASVEELGCDMLVSVDGVLGLNGEGVRAPSRGRVNRQVKLVVRGVVPRVVGGSHWQLDRYVESKWMERRGRSKV